MLSNNDVINVDIFERVKNHGKKFLKLSQTSFSSIVNCTTILHYDSYLYNFRDIPP